MSSSKNMLVAALLLAVAGSATVASAQQVLTAGSYASTIAVNVPRQPAGPTCTAVPSDAATDAMALKRTFMDNFDALDLSTNRWTPHYDGGYDDIKKVWLGYDWVSKRTLSGNHEQQIYVDPGYKGLSSSPLGLNPFVNLNGSLRIVAQRTPLNLKTALSDFEFTSGVLTTRKSHIQRYGYFEARIKVPSGQALLPAFWMLPFDKSWPPELDIMEAPTQLANTIQHSSHWKSADGKVMSSGCRTVLPNYQWAFHQYGALWTAEKIVYYVDRVPIAQIATPPGMNVPMYMILNLAVGADWVGKATATTPMPAEMLVDIVAAYSQEGPAACGVTTNGVTQCPAK
jgi:beta-glucanase (GH16 family)